MRTQFDCCNKISNKLKHYFRPEAINLNFCNSNVYDEHKSVVEIDENLPKFHKIAVFQYQDEGGSLHIFKTGSSKISFGGIHRYLNFKIHIIRIPYISTYGQYHQPV